MSYNLSVSDNSSSFNRYIPEMVSTDTIDYHLLFDFPLSSPLYDFSSDFNLEALLNSDQNQQNPVDEPIRADQLLSDLLPFSSPTHQLENRSLYQATQFSSLSFGPNFENGFENFSSLNCLEVKNEGCQVDFDSAYNSDVNKNATKYLQRSFSGDCFEGKPSSSFQPPFDSPMESQGFHGQALSLPEDSFFTGHMRKVSSTGDLENMRNVQTPKRSISTPSAMENSFMEESPFKVGRYSPEERQERISKYRAKRNQRNFNKTIKYACRKTLADNRPRIRGRFARNDETVGSPKPACSTRDEDEDEDDRWALLHEVEDETMARAIGTLMNNFSQQQFQYHHGRF